MSCLIVTNKKRGKKPGESDVFFWEDILDAPPEPFTKKEFDVWGIPTLIKGGPGSGFFDHSGRPGLVGGSAPGEGSAMARESVPFTGKTIRDSEGNLTQENGSPLPEHVQKVYIAPSLTDVTFNTDPNASCVAKGRDAKGRLQGIYKGEYTDHKADQKFARVKDMDQKFDDIFEQNKADLKSSDQRVKDSAEIWKLISETGIRPGSEKDTKAEVQAYGAVTLLGKHVVPKEDGTVELKYMAKCGVEQNVPVTNKDTASILSNRSKSAGEEGRLFSPSYKQFNSYSKELMNGEYLTKDLRTLLGTRLGRN
jgi:hypothetical protein